MSTTPQERAELLALVGDFARRRIAPRVAEYDEREEIPQDLLAEMAELGLFGGAVPEEYGGLGLDYVTYAQVIEEVSRVCHIMGVLMSMPTSLVGGGIAAYGSTEQIERYLRPLAQGRIFGAAGVTEPRSGSDVAGMESRYRKEGDDFIIDGRKAWISNLDIADFVVTFASHDRSLGRKGVSAFIIPMDTPGVSTHPYRNKLGFRPICTGDLILDGVRLGPDALLGTEGDGFRVAMTAVEKGRLSVAARAVGLTQACLTDSIAYANSREAFGTTIDRFQIVQSKITDMAVGVRTARLLVEDAARELDQGLRARASTSMAKMYASDVALRSASDAVQIHGAAGVSPEYRVGRFFRDAKVLQIVEGSNDLHRALIAEMELGLRSRG
jgi:alkylation response protein AidB-like acyl-CoA dehydrogenase